MRHLWFLENRKTQALVEYALLVALVAACLVAILGLTRNAARGAYARTPVGVAPVGDSSRSAGATWQPISHSGGTNDETDSARAEPGDCASAGIIPGR